MKELADAIRIQGKGIGSDIVKVDMFLNHRIDTGLLFRMGENIAKHFAAKDPQIVLTVESSGIALAIAAAHALNDIPVVFAKKARASNQSPNMLEAPVYSFTRKTENVIRVDRAYLPSGARVLIIDDFLANGQAVRGLMSLIYQADCKTIGVGIAVEKGFQPGGAQLRTENVDLYSLAIVTGIEGSVITLNEGRNE